MKVHCPEDICCKQELSDQLTAIGYKMLLEYLQHLHEYHRDCPHQKRNSSRNVLIEIQ